MDRHFACSERLSVQREGVLAMVRFIVSGAGRVFYRQPQNVNLDIAMKREA